MNRSKRIEMGTTPKGGLRSGARPGGKDLLGKNHEAASISWTRRAIEMRNADCGMRIEKEDSKIRNPQFEIRNSKGRCFLRTSSFPPGHNPSIPKISNAVSPPAELAVSLNLN